MVKIKKVSWFISVTLNEKRTCYGSTHKKGDLEPNGWCQAHKKTWYLMDGAEHRVKTWNLMDGAEHRKETWNLMVGAEHRKQETWYLMDGAKHTGRLGT